MADVTITYKGANIATMDATGSKTLQTAGTYCEGDIGVEYVKPGGDKPDPTDGKTHIWIQIAESAPANRRTFYLRWTQSMSNGVTVDWGDGSTPETYGGTDAANYSHTYAAGGDYEITLEVTSGTISFVGDSDNRIYGGKGTSNQFNRCRIHRVFFGSGVAIDGVGQYVFYQCYGLTSITISDDVTTIGQYAFYQCYGLALIPIPDSVTSIGNNAMQYCYNLVSVTIPDSVTNIGDNAFYGCSALVSITIPESVTNIGSNAFYNCYGMSEYHLMPTIPPALANYNAFNAIPTDCIIYVPRGSLSAYKTATNWSTYASRMQEEPQ